MTKMSRQNRLLMKLAVFSGLLALAAGQCTCPNMDPTSDGTDTTPGVVEFPPTTDYSPDGCSMTATCTGEGPLIECVFLDGDTGTCSKVGGSDDAGPQSSAVDFTCQDGAWMVSDFPDVPIENNVYCQGAIITTTSTTTSTTSTTTASTTTEFVFSKLQQPW